MFKSADFMTYQACREKNNISHILINREKSLTTPGKIKKLKKINIGELTKIDAIYLSNLQNLSMKFYFPILPTLNL